MGALLDIPTREEMLQLSVADRMALCARLYRAEREVFAGFVDLVDVMDAEGDHVADGHRSVRNLLVAVGNDDHAAARVKVKTMKAMRLLPNVQSAVRVGEVGIAQVQTLGNAAANPRARDFLAVVEDQLLDWTLEPFAEFDGRVRDFVRLADADGAEQRDNARHDARSYHHSRSGDGYNGNYGCGTTQGAVIAKILDHFTKKEFEADWSDAKNRVGDKVTQLDLERSHEQRRMDALYHVFVAAAAATPGLAAPAPLVNLVMDPRTLDETIEWATTGVRPAPDLSDIASRRCHTTDGVPIPPADALAAVLQGHIRRVVMDQGVVIDQGRRHRLFTGNARDAVMLRATHCIWAGCDVPASRCEADHTHPWNHHGHTNADSGAPACDHHNRWKTRGFTTTNRDGQWHTLRPDGTDITGPPGHAPPVA